jgi:curved DNA-binding protein CbpA
MKTFNHLNYYEILKIPLNADAEMIQNAYREALETYEGDSLITYSLFSDEERADLLQSIDEAFHTLIDQDRRDAYNRTLINSGRRIDTLAAAPKPPEVRTAPAEGPSRESKHRDLPTWVKKRSQEENIKVLIDDMMDGDSISGKHLKKLREALDIELSEIFGLTRISISTLTMIEGDQFESLPADIFLRAFLKSFAEILQIDPHRVVQGYLKSKASADGLSKSK